MLIRQAQREDEKKLADFLKGIGILSKGQPFDHFWIALEGEELIGSVRVEQHQGFAFLSHLGVTVEKRKRGVAECMIEEALRQVHTPVYAYTVIPHFFEKMGFKATEFHPNLPPREMFGCDGCDADRCCCMVRSTHDS